MINALNQNRVRVLRWAGTIGSLILLLILFTRQGWGEVIIAFKQVPVEHFALGLLFIFISRFAVIGRWYFLLQPVVRVSLWQSIRITFAGLFASNFLPTTVGGDVVRLAGAVQLKIDGVVSAASLVVDRLIGMLGMFLVLPFATKPFIQWLSIPRYLPVGLKIGVSFTWFNDLWRKGVEVVRRIFKAVGIWSKHPKTLLISFVFTSVHMVCLYGILNMYLDDMDNPLPFTLIAGLWSFVYFITLLPISINGYGVQELSMALIFSEVGGISLQSGLTVSVLFRTLMMIGSLPGVLFIPGILARTKTTDDDNN